MHAGWPIHHHKEARVRSHVFLCMLAYYVEWHMREKWAPLLFDDHDKASAQAARESVVQKAQRSEAAKRKAASKRTEDGFAVESFQGMLSLLGTIVKNWLQPSEPAAEPFTMITTPNPLQRRALDLLGVTLRP